jgi:sugar diacid utilization regulator
MGEAAIERYMNAAEQHVAEIEHAISNADDVVAFVKQLLPHMRLDQIDAHRDWRMDQAVLIAQTKTNPYLASLLAVGQSRLTERLATSLFEAQAAGKIGSGGDPRAVALFIQACTFGSLLDDIARDKINSATWTQLITLVLDRALS